MRVLLIDVNCKSGSTGKLVYDLYHEINKKGYTAAIAYGRGPIVQEPNIYRFGVALETNFHVLMNRLTGIHGSFSYFSTIRLIRFIKKFKPDVIHIHELHGYFINIVSILKFIKNLGIKVVWTFHCEYMYEGKGFILDKKNYPTWSRKKEYPLSYFFEFSKFTVKRYKRILDSFPSLTLVSPSKWLKNRTYETYLKKFPMIVINNGINQEIFNIYENNDVKKLYNLPANKTIVLSVAPSFNDPRKGGHHIIDIASKVNNPNLCFLMVGDNNLTKISDNVIFIPRTKNQIELAKLYSFADYFLITSSIENFPTTCIEALSCGTPVIGIKSGGTEETAPDKFGSFFELNEISKIVDFFNSIDPKIEYFPSSQVIRSFATQKYSKKIMFDSYMKIYEEKKL